MLSATTTALFLLTSFITLPATAQQPRVQKQPDGIILTLPAPHDHAARTVRLQVVSDHIIHVLASVLDSVSSEASLMVVARPPAPVPWQYREKNGLGVLSTASLRVTVTLATGEILFADAQGRPILQERPNGGKTFVPVTLDGQTFYQVTQTFESPADEGLYGLGQHQNGVMNYRGQQVELAQNNTEVAVPFLVSSKNYGIL